VSQRGEASVEEDVVVDVIVCSATLDDARSDQLGDNTDVSDADHQMAPVLEPFTRHRDVGVHHDQGHPASRADSCVHA
jgi:hypothetical protein